MKYAWRGFVDHDGDIVAWPTLLADHNQFHFAFHTSDEDFIARWRQWSPGGKVDFDPGVSETTKQLVNDWVQNA